MKQEGNLISDQELVGKAKKKSKTATVKRALGVPCSERHVQRQKSVKADKLGQETTPESAALKARTKAKPATDDVDLLAGLASLDFEAPVVMHCVVLSYWF